MRVPTVVLKENIHGKNKRIQTRHSSAHDFKKQKRNKSPTAALHGD
jgi:hypothetical protein